MAALWHSQRQRRNWAIGWTARGKASSNLLRSVGLHPLSDLLEAKPEIATLGPSADASAPDEQPAPGAAAEGEAPEKSDH